MYLYPDIARRLYRLAQYRGRGLEVGGGWEGFRSWEDGGLEVAGRESVGSGAGQGGGERPRGEDLITH